jgi:hypothetical protein
MAGRAGTHQGHSGCPRAESHSERTTCLPRVRGCRRSQLAQETSCARVGFSMDCPEAGARTCLETGLLGQEHSAWERVQEPAISPEGSSLGTTGSRLPGLARSGVDEGHNPASPYAPLGVGSLSKRRGILPSEGIDTSQYVWPKGGSRNLSAITDWQVFAPGDLGRTSASAIRSTR